MYHVGELVNHKPTTFNGKVICIRQNGLILGGYEHLIHLENGQSIWAIQKEMELLKDQNAQNVMAPCGSGGVVVEKKAGK